MDWLHFYIFLMRLSHFVTKQHLKRLKRTCKFFIENSDITIKFLVEFPMKPNTQLENFQNDVALGNKTLQL